MTLFNRTLLIAAMIALPATAGFADNDRRWTAYPSRPSVVLPEDAVRAPDARSQRDPTGILRGQGISSRYGGMGGMGGGSGRSANTGVGLGGIGANQGARN